MYGCAWGEARTRDSKTDTARTLMIIQLMIQAVRPNVWQHVQLYMLL